MFLTEIETSIGASRTNCEKNQTLEQNFGHKNIVEDLKLRIKFPLGYYQSIQERRWNKENFDWRLIIHYFVVRTSLLPLKIWYFQE